MASRSRTFLFIQYRNSFGHVQRRKRTQALQQQTEEEGLIERQNDDGEVVIEMSHLPPRWVDLTEDVTEQLAEIEQKIAHLDELHRKHLLPGFDDRSSEEREINMLTQEITQQFQASGSVVRGIGQVQVHGQEGVVGRNIQSALAARLQAQSDAFRKSQSVYLQKISKRKGASVDVFALDEEHERAVSRKFDMNLTDEQLLVMEQNESEIARREGELAHIHESIVELAGIFGQMQEMIIDQGTMLDRIDYNVENTVVNVAAAADELEKADKHQKNSVANKCIIVMGIVIVILFIILLVKWL
ncbi:Integral membrane protein SED5 [Linderina macrospora]|uniref:Integral membrane protein SED5 n=1 Tax=Linderina macrospora TaxID=4868 RepID=A0ACC1JGK9_9FUNG|nr:Integral membrane protein SED5 [Linderina macrospora]